VNYNLPPFASWKTQAGNINLSDSTVAKSIYSIDFFLQRTTLQHVLNLFLEGLICHRCQILRKPMRQFCFRILYQPMNAEMREGKLSVHSRSKTRELSEHRRQTWGHHFSPCSGNRSWGAASHEAECPITPLALHWRYGMPVSAFLCIAAFT